MSLTEESFIYEIDVNLLIVSHNRYTIFDVKRVIRTVMDNKKCVRPK